MPIDVSPVSVPHLMALARGVVCQGDLRCFYCGAPCDGSNSVAEHVKETFTGHGQVMAPGSPGTCNGCVLAFAGSADVPVFAGGVRRPERPWPR